MKYKLVKLKHLSGNKASVYTIYLYDENITLFERFLKENFNLYLSEINNILDRLKVIGNDTGAREIFFRLEEGHLGDGVEALADYPEFKLRLYCIRYGSAIVIVGGGGPKTVRALQEDEKLKYENFLMREISNQITQRIREKRIEFSSDELDFIGELEFNNEQDA